MKTKLKMDEVILIERILTAVEEIMEEDKILSDSDNEIIYSDGGRFLYSMTEEEIIKLRTILKTI